MTGPGSGKRGRPHGLPKTGGRTPGTPNRSSLVLRNRLAELQCDAVQELLTIARDPNTTIAQRISIYAAFLRFTHPMPKPVDTLDGESVVDERQITLDEALQWAQYMLERFGPNAGEQADVSAHDETQVNQRMGEEGNDSQS